MLRVGGAETVTEVEGPGRRFALWLQGCSRRCRGCCNPHLHNFSAGEPVPAHELAARITTSDSDGLTIVGGEPLEQLPGLKHLFDHLQTMGYDKSIMMFSGFSYAEIEADPEKLELVRRCDVLVAGPFVQQQAPDTRRWIGSRNQTVHFLGSRLDFLKDEWPAHKLEIEIHLDDEQISINGFPVGEKNEFEQIFVKFQERQT